MATKDEILSRLLKEENYVSGEELARQTGVSRAAVWKAIKSLKKADMISRVLPNAAINSNKITAL